MDDPSKFELIEELPPQPVAESASQSSNLLRSPLLHRQQTKRAKSVIKRVVRNEENVYAVQTAWKTTGRLLLHEKEFVPEKVSMRSELQRFEMKICFLRARRFGRDRRRRS